MKSIFSLAPLAFAIALTGSASAKKIEFPCQPEAGYFSNWESDEIQRPVQISGVIDVNHLDLSSGQPTANIRLIDSRGKNAALLRLAMFPSKPGVLVSMVEFTEDRDTVQHQLVTLPLDSKNISFSFSYVSPDTIVASINGKQASISGLPMKISRVGLTCASGAFTFRDISTGAN